MQSILKFTVVLALVAAPLGAHIVFAGDVAPAPKATEKPEAPKAADADAISTTYKVVIDGMS